MQRRPSVAAVLVSALVLAACDSGSDIQPIEPPENAAEPEPEPAPEPVEGPDDDVPEIFQGQLYPPLPALEPDPAAGDLESQERVIPIHQDLYELVQTALATNELDQPAVSELSSESYLAEIVDEIENQRDLNAVSLGPDSEIAWVEVIVADEDQVVIGECSVLGPRSGGYDVDTGEPIFDTQDSPRVEIVNTYTYESNASASRGWEATRFTTTTQEGCSARA